jgi:cell wall-associated NlpC family hydrolase
MLLVSACMLTAILSGGCSASRSRFSSEPPPEEEARVAERIKEEETREDDRHVDLSRLSKELTHRPAPGNRYSNRTPPAVNRDRVLLEIVSMLGVPYSSGGSSKSGMDCSGFTCHVYRTAVNLTLPRSAREQFRAGAEVEKDSLEFGDLVFFNTTGYAPSHVGIYVEDDLFAHASISYGVTFSSLESTYYRTRFVGARRVVVGKTHDD